MTLYHAWMPNEDGSKPVGTLRQIVRSDLKTDRGARAWAIRWGGLGVRVDAYRDSIHFYSNEPGRIVKAW